MTAHAKLSASGSHRWLNCPASVALEQSLPNGDRTSQYAEEGTAAHELGEKCLKSGNNANDYLGQKFNGFEVTDEMADHVQTYVDYVRSVGGELFVETRVNFGQYVSGGFGTCDALIIKGNTLYVTDLKFGKGLKVDAHKNSQGMLYALGALYDFGMLFDEIEKVVISIVQPRVDNISVYETTVDDLYQWAEWVKERAQLALSDNAPFAPSEKACQFCRAKPVCQALNDHTQAVIMSDFDSLTNNDLTPVNKLTNDQLRLALDSKKLIISWLEAVEGYVTEKVNAGETFTGYKLVAGRSLRQWANEATAEQLLTETLGDAAYEPRKLLSVAKAEKALGKNKTLLSELVIKPEGKPALVPEDDPRPAFGVTTADFD
jgi:hypothetical protein